MDSLHPDVGGGMPRWRLPPRRSYQATGVALLIGGVLLLVVPYFLPMHSSLSDSYCFGFNNRGAVVLWVLFSIGFGYWRGPLTKPKVFSGQDQGSRRPLWAMLILATLLHLCAWLAGLWYGPLQEAKYLVDRLQHLAGGEHVFRDFEMAYGAGLLYFPLWISRLLHVSLLSGYSLALLVEQDIGILLLWYVVQSVGKGNSRRNNIFLLICLTCLAWIPLVPEQYTTFRYWLSPAIAVLAYRLAFDLQQRLVALLVLIAGFGLTLLVSQEQALAMLGGVLLFSVLFLGPQWKRYLPGLAIFAAAAAMMLWGAYRAKWLETLLNIGTGAYAVPIGPAPILLPMLTLLVVAACYFIEAIRRRSPGSLQGLLLCLSPFSLTAAFGRFDAVHLIANTFCAGLVGWLALSWNDQWYRRVRLVYVLLVFIFPTQLPIVYRDDLNLMLHAERKDPENTLLRPGLPTFYSPMGSIGTVHPGERLPFNYVTGRFYGTTDLITPKQADELVEEIRSKHEQPILVPPMGCTWGANRKSVMLYNTGLYYPRARRANSDLRAICEELELNYEEVPHAGLALGPGLRIVRRKSNRP